MVNKKIEKLINRRNFIIYGAVAAFSLSVPAFINYKVKKQPQKKRLVFDKPLTVNQFVVEREFVLFLTEDKGPIAISRICPHLGCTIIYDDSKGIFKCPCHGSEFSKIGKYLSGPAKKGLQTLKVSQPNNALNIYEITLPESLLL